MRIVFATALLASPVLAQDKLKPTPEPTFTRIDISAAYALGRADAQREGLMSLPEMKALSEKLHPLSTSLAADPKGSPPPLSAAKP